MILLEHPKNIPQKQNRWTNLRMWKIQDLFEYLVVQQLM